MNATDIYFFMPVFQTSLFLIEFPVNRCGTDLGVSAYFIQFYKLPTPDSNFSETYNFLKMQNCQNPTVYVISFYS